MMLRGHHSISGQGRQCLVSRDTVGSITPQGSCIPGSGWDEACRWPKQSREWRAERSRSGREQIWMWEAKKTQVKRKETKLRMGRPEFRTFLRLLCDLGQVSCPLWEIAGRYLLSPPWRNARMWICIFLGNFQIWLCHSPAPQVKSNLVSIAPWHTPYYVSLGTSKCSSRPLPAQVEKPWLDPVTSSSGWLP